MKSLLLCLVFSSVCYAEYTYSDNPDARPYVQFSYGAEFQNGEAVSSLDRSIFSRQPVYMRNERFALDFVKPVSNNLSFLTTLTKVSAYEEIQQTYDPTTGWTAIRMERETDGYGFNVSLRYYFPVGY